MTEAYAFTHKFRARPSDLHDASSRKSLKRSRDSLVCRQCKISKIRCDRNQPCGNCVRRNTTDGCVYPTSAEAGDDADALGTIEQKLARIESMVREAMTSQSSTQLTENATRHIATLQTADGVLQQRPAIENTNEADERVTDDNYVGSTHWSVILDDLHDLKSILIPSYEVDVTRSAREKPCLGDEPIFGAFSSFSLDRIIADFLPDKVEVDRLVSLYFQGPFFIIPFLHMTQFQRQYHSFWANKAEINPLWLSILFSICYMASQVRQIEGSAGPPLKHSFTGNSFLHHASGQCLVLGEYNRPQFLGIEALSMYAQSKHLQTLDPCREAGVILSMAVRTAYHLGFHRDPDSTGSFSVFEGEMRRRCWAICKQMDLMTSFELGLPSNICLENCDTKSPRNLFDSDFDEDTTELPPSRTEHEATRQLWFIVKDRMMTCYSKVCRDALSFDLKSEQSILELHGEILQMHETIPEVLRIRPMSESLTESPFIIVTRLYVEFIYLKCLCVLHRRYMTRGSAFSTASCIEAGIKLVDHFLDVAKEFAPGGQLFMQRWMLTNYTMNDFLLGLMILCLALHINRYDRVDQQPIDASRQQEIIKLLDSSRAILTDKAEASIDARRVLQIVSLSLDGRNQSSRETNRQSSSAAVDVEQQTRESAGHGLTEPFTRSFEPSTFLNNAIGDLDWMLFDFGDTDLET